MHNFKQMLGILAHRDLFSAKTTRERKRIGTPDVIQQCSSSLAPPSIKFYAIFFTTKSSITFSLENKFSLSYEYINGVSRLTAKNYVFASVTIDGEP